MKSLVATLVSLFFIQKSNAQTCMGYFYMSSKEIQMTMYDKKGGESGKLTYTISNVNTVAGTTTATFNSVMVNEKGKEMGKSSGSYKCNGGQLLVDARVGMPSDGMSQAKDMEVKADSSFIEYPAKLSQGETLKDAFFKIEMYQKGQLYSTTSYEALNRKVVAKESVTTSAGTWEAYKITSVGRTKTTMAMMNIGIPFNFQMSEWFVPGFGIIKSETYNKNGKLVGSQAITSIKK